MHAFQTIYRRSGILSVGTLSVPIVAALVAVLPAPASATEPSGFTGCYAVRDGSDTPRRTTLDQEHADHLFTPASVTKLVTTLAALELLGPDHRVRTELRAVGAVQGRRLAGDLVLVGAGDATWSRRFFEDEPRRPLRLLAERLAERVDRVDGDLVLDLSHFPGRPFPPSRAVSEIAYAYGAPTGALAVDENFVWLRIAPGAAVGEPARVEFETAKGEARPDGIDNLTITNWTVTAPKSRHEKGTFDVLPSWSGDVLVVRGEYPISEPSYRLPVAVHDGELRAGRALRQQLLEAGVEVTGDVRMTTTRPPTRQALAAVESPLLRDWLEPILEDSENWLAEMLLRVVAAETLGEGRTDDGIDHVVSTLIERARLAEGSLELEDGSGLSPYDLVTPRAMVQLLTWGRSRPWWTELKSALPAPDDGTLAAWPGLPAGTRAKTGTLRHTVALAGIVESSDGTVTFACFVNHATEERADLRRRLAARIRGWR